MALDLWWSTRHIIGYSEIRQTALMRLLNQAEVIVHSTSQHNAWWTDQKLVRKQQVISKEHWQTGLNERTSDLHFFTHPPELASSAIMYSSPFRASDTRVLTARSWSFWRSRSNRWMCILGLTAVPAVSSSCLWSICDAARLSTCVPTTCTSLPSRSQPKPFINKSRDFPVPGGPATNTSRCDSFSASTCLGWSTMSTGANLLAVSLTPSPRVRSSDDWAKRGTMGQCTCTEVAGPQNLKQTEDRGCDTSDQICRSQISFRERRGNSSLSSKDRVLLCQLYLPSTVCFYWNYRTNNLNTEE